MHHSVVTLIRMPCSCVLQKPNCDLLVSVKRFLTLILHTISQTLQQRPWWARNPNVVRARSLPDQQSYELVGVDRGIDWCSSAWCRRHWRRMGSSRREIGLGGLREVINLDRVAGLRSSVRGWHWDLLTALSNILGSEVCIVASICLDRFQALACLLSCDALQLLCLLVDNLGYVLVLRVDEFFILCVHEWDKEGHRSCEKSKAPSWQKFEKVVADESS